MQFEKLTTGTKFRVTMTCSCPVCSTVWKFQYFEWAESEAKIQGLVETEHPGLWRVSSEKWGVHALCGKCRARNLAMQVIHKPGQSRITQSGWTSEDEAKMRGNLKHQQVKFAAWAKAVVEPEGEQPPLIDEPRDERRRILPAGRIHIGLEWREER